MVSRSLLGPVSRTIPDIQRRDGRMSRLRTLLKHTRVSAVDGRYRRVPAAVAAVLVAVTMLASPAQAMAARYRSDVVGGAPISSGTVRPSDAPDIAAVSGILVTGDGRVLWSRASDSRLPMASTTKMMTALIAIEQGGLDRVVTVSQAAASTPYGIGLAAGTRLTRGKLLELALVASSNDAAYALGESSGQGMPAFVAKMNERASQLGMGGTHYMNPHGLDTPEHYSTAHDLTVVLRELVKHAQFRRTASLRSVSAPGIASLKATDELLGRYPGLVGGKTGTTTGAGYCFVATAKRGGIALYAALLHTPSNMGRFDEAAHLLDWGFRHVGSTRLTPAGAPAGTVPIAGAPSRHVPVTTSAPASALTLDVAEPVKRSVSLPASLALPVRQGQRVGEVTFSQGGAVLARVPAIAAASVGSVDETVGTVPVTDYLDVSVPAHTATAAAVPAFDESRPVSRRVVLRPGVDAPVSKGQALGEVVYSQGAHVIMRVPVVATASVRRPGALEAFGIALARGWQALIGAPGRGSVS
jgi:serine-type D-Ala-D-Ala carboxypeptidase (penicillin-binding protein 5/6)